MTEVWKLAMWRSLFLINSAAVSTAALLFCLEKHWCSNNNCNIIYSSDSKIHPWTNAVLHSCNPHTFFGLESGLLWIDMLLRGGRERGMRGGEEALIYLLGERFTQLLFPFSVKIIKCSA